MAHWPEVLSLGTACVLAVVWFGVMAVLLVLPFGLLGVLLIADRRRPWRRRPVADANGLRDAIDAMFQITRKTDAGFACILVQMHDAAAGSGPAGQAVAGDEKKRCLERISRVLRDEDRFFDLPQGRIAILLSPGGGLDRAAVLSIAERLQSALTALLSDAHGHPRIAAALGICLDAAARDRSGRAMIAALEETVARAARDGSPAIRFHGEAYPS